MRVCVRQNLVSRLVVVPALMMESFTDFAMSQASFESVESGVRHDVAHISNAEVSAISAALVVFFIFISAVVYVCN